MSDGLINRSQMNKLYVIGIGYKPLDKRAREIILNSSVILASNRLFEVFKEYEEHEAVKDKIKVINNIDQTIEFIRNCFQSSALSPKPLALLASGDPMFFGIGRRAVREFGKENVEIIPDLSSIQVAFSRIKEPWDDAFLMSLHGGPDPEKRRRLPYTINDIPTLLQKHNKIAILTDRENNPSEIARVLNLSPVAHSLLPVMFVCEKLGYPDERIVEGAPERSAKMTFSEPNVVVIQRTVDGSQKTDIVFGLREEEFTHSRGLITKDEVRSVVIHRLRLPQRGIFWDIGAGSGSLSVEISRLSPGLKVYAIERDTKQIGHLIKNKERFSLSFEIISGEAPDILMELPAPDRVFIGGSRGRLEDIIRLIDRRVTSVIVVLTATTLETLNKAITLFREKNFSIDVVQMNISRLKPLGRGHTLSPQNPVFVITGTKDKETDVT